MIKKFVALVLLAILALSSCAPSDSFIWELDGSMTEDERTAFYEAAERWNEVAIRQNYISEDANGTHRVFLRVPDAMPVPGTAGIFMSPPGVMFIKRGMPRERFLAVVLHEMGHALGLALSTRDGDGHIEGPGVMNIYATQVDFSEGDLAECRRVKACR